MRSEGFQRWLSNVSQLLNLVLFQAGLCFASCVLYKTSTMLEVKNVSGKLNSAQSMSVGEVASRSGLPVSTLHFYETKGLLKPQRTAGNQRVYGRGVLRRIAIIKIAQSSGIPLAEIREALAPIPDDRQPSAQEWAEVSRKWADSLRERIERLTHLQRNLESCIGCGCLTLGGCPLRNPEDMLSQGASGAVLFERELSGQSQ
ncbi:redox-sensitive transcriptional activator SoxR [Pseudomonas sp. NPDC089734]|uniref:redox-sensitive transcriptional activator SoxR n=1 Tax=Pseudomonas sp. NPDC089734 TaxID=3364469 RepID=UPI003817D272